MKGKIIAVDLKTLDQKSQYGIRKTHVFFIQY